ncbi:MAG: DUF11 domain-containing protein [Gammaproteobacteria bacterium]|nr:DUF11 domain-containing protein [Gammaproteobacteria bacterium]
MRMRFKPFLHCLGLFLCAAAALIPLRQADAQGYTITDLGVNIYPYDISNNGIITGGDANQSPPVAMVRKDGVNKLIGPSGVASRANVVNSAGMAVGHELVNSTPQRAFLWQEGRGVSYFDANAVQARGVNDFDQVTGVALVDGLERPYLYDAITGKMNLLPTLAGHAWGTSVNSFAAVAGVSRGGDGILHAFIYSLTNGLHQLDIDNPMPGFIGSHASAVNDDNQVVGWAFSNLSEKDSSKRAYVWVRGPGMQDLGVIGKDIGSVANDINRVGHVVGYSALNDAGLTRAFFHDRKSGGVAALTSVVISSSPPVTLVFLGTSNNGVFRSADAGASIVSRNAGLGNLSITELARGAAGTVYAGTGSGIYKSIDAGDNWTAVNNGLVFTDNSTPPRQVVPAITALVVDPNDSATLYAGTPVGIYRSTDGGASWATFNGGITQNPIIHDLAAGISGSGSTVVYAATSGGVYASDASAAGASWQTIQGDLQERNVTSIQVGAGVLYVGVGSSIRKGTPGAGNSWAWTALNDGLSGGAVRTLRTICPATGACIIYAGLSTGVYKLTDGTSTWTPMTTAGLTNLDVLALSVAPTAPSPTVFAGTQSGMFRIVEGDAQWELTNNMQDLNGLIPANSGWVLFNASGINNAGQIVGWGAFNGQIHGFLLTPEGGKIPTAQLAVTKTLPSGPYPQHVPVAYSITVTNNGPDTATSVLLGDWLPDTVTFQSDQAAGCNRTSDSALVCALGDLASGQSKTVRLVVTPNGPDVRLDNIARAVSNESDPAFSDNTSSVQGKTDKCFIATAAYGSFLDPHVQALRDFRDRYLLTNAPGRAFVAWYYEHSPPLAAFIARHDSLRATARAVLTPVVYAVKYPAAAFAVALLGMAGVGGYAYRRRMRCV